MEESYKGLRERIAAQKINCPNCHMQLEPDKACKEAREFDYIDGRWQLTNYMVLCPWCMYVIYIDPTELNNGT